jgi:ABC-type lipoprotein export system ATPase subunit
MKAVVSCSALCCQRPNWHETGRAAIENITASFDQGMLCEFRGPDGAGIALLLSVLGLLEPADSGSLCVDGQSVTALREEDVQRCRNRLCGFLFHNPCLLPSFSVAENVAMPLFRICGSDADVAQERTSAVLDFCGISHLENQLAGRLSASAQHRAALARALVHRPKVLVALSLPGSCGLFDLAKQAASELGLCVLWAEEDGKISRSAQRRIQIEAGRITSDELL